MAPLAVIDICSESEQFYHENRFGVSSDDAENRLLQQHLRSPLAPLAQEIKRSLHVSTSGKRVQFSPHVRVESIPHVSDVSISDRNSIWLTDADRKRIKDENRSIVRMMTLGTIPKVDFERADSEEIVCTRGLEIRTRQGARRRAEKRERARKVVLRAQEFQQSDGFFDERYIAEQYKNCTIICQEEAHHRGIADQSEARRVLKA